MPEPQEALAVRQPFFTKPAGGLVYFCPKCKLRNQLFAPMTVEILTVRCKICGTEARLKVIDKALRDDKVGKIWQDGTSSSGSGGGQPSSEPSSAGPPSSTPTRRARPSGKPATPAARKSTTQR